MEVDVPLLSEAIRLRREELGLDQSELAGRLGVGQQTVSRWETGSGLPRRERLPQLAEALEFDPSHLLRLAGYLPRGEEESASAAFHQAYERAAEFADDELVLLLDRLWNELRSRAGFRAPHPRPAEPGDAGRPAPS
jgi:transcriptional regulator with XRE-family HTH domain